MDPGNSTRGEGKRREWSVVFFLALLGAYANGAIYGFQYPAGPDYSLMLPFANWLRDPSLYAGDALRNVYPHIQTFYWPVVATLSKHFKTENVLFVLFLTTKFIFFAAVGRLFVTRVQSRLLAVCAVLAIALSGVLNGQTPIGGTIVLDEISEHAALALALVLLAGVFLIEGRWLWASIIAASSAYVDALQLLHMLPAFALFAVMDWREQKTRILSAAALGAGAILPWWLHFHKTFISIYPAGYVSALLINNPAHLTLRWTAISQIAVEAAILLAAVGMSLLARKWGLPRERRPELMAISYLAVVSVGVIAGKFWLVPDVARFMLPRADSLLLPYAFLLVQIYGVRLLERRSLAPVTTSLFSAIAIVSPLWEWLAVVLPAVGAFLLAQARWQWRLFVDFSWVGEGASNFKGAAYRSFLRDRNRSVIRVTAVLDRSTLGFPDPAKR